MNELVNDLAKILNSFAQDDGFHESPAPGVYCIKISQPGRRAKIHYRAGLGIVAQGRKEIVLDREIFRCEEAHYIATPIDLPVISRVAPATSERPFLCLLISLDPLVISEVTSQPETGAMNEAKAPARALFHGKASEQMLEAALRLGKLFQTPEDAFTLGPLVVKEILYHLLKGTEGSAIRQFVRSGSKMHKITQAVHTLRSDLNEEIDVPALAKAANMSRSAFFKHFKEVTAMSPIQYQKRLRLLEARRLMVETDETAERSAFEVGYKSVSQFSREYSRMFGNSPLRDAMKFRQTGDTINQI